MTSTAVVAAGALSLVTSWMSDSAPVLNCPLLVGGYAHAYYLGDRKKNSLGETVKAYREYLPEFFALPHPSWRNIGWLKRNPWFAKDVLPALRRRLRTV